MENRRKLIVAFSLIVGALVLVYAYVENNIVDFPIGLVLVLTGIVLWICAE
jgi:drug/metabolite transporter (DMT)-like permease